MGDSLDDLDDPKCAEQLMAIPTMRQLGRKPKRQTCSRCESPTGRCEDDSLYADEDHEDGPLCEECYNPNAEAHGRA